MRRLATICLFLILWPYAVADAGAVPVVTNITGNVAVLSGTGARRDVLSSQILHSGDVLITGMNSLAIIGLADVGRVRLGPATTATALNDAGGLLVRLHVGALCVQSDVTALTIDAGTLRLKSDSKATVFNLVRTATATDIAVYQGRVRAMLGDAAATFEAGSAGRVANGRANRIPIASMHRQFSTLRCPDGALIAQAEAIANRTQSRLAAGELPPTGASQTPQPTTNEPSSGGGGGGGVIGILLGLAGLAALAAGHGGNGSGSPPAGNPSPLPSPSPSPGPFTLQPTALTFGDIGSANAATFDVSESGFSGGFTVDASGCNGIATVSAPPYNGPRSTITVTPQGSGGCSLNVSDGHGGSAAVNISVGPFGALTADPGPFTFNSVGDTAAVHASESNYTGPINATVSDPSVATISPGSGTSPAAFTLRSQGVGNANVVLTDDHGGRQTALVSVVIGGISVNPVTLQFANPFDPGQSFVASDSPPVDFTAFTSDPNVAVVNFDHGNARRSTFVVSPVGVGKASITVFDSNGSQAVVSVGVGQSPLRLRATVMQRHPPTAAPMPVASPRAPIARPSVQPAARPPAATVLVVAPVPSAGKEPALSVLSVSASALMLSAGGAPGTVSISELGYHGAFIATSSDPTVAAVAFDRSPGPNATINIIPRATGSAMIRISDERGAVQMVRVLVGPRLERVIRPGVKSPL